MNMAVCPRCGLTDFEIVSQGLAETGAWAEEFVRRCEHVHERRHLKDLRTHSCPHWAKAMQDAVEAQERGEGQERGKGAEAAADTTRT